MPSSDVSLLRISPGKHFEAHIHPILHDDITDGVRCSPIHRLPPEMLSEIFLHYLNSVVHGAKRDKWQQSWLKLMHVSRLWSHVAYQAPQLWAEIHVPPRFNDKDEEWIQKGLVLSKSVPISVRALLAPHIPQRNRELLIKILREHQSRIRALCIYFPDCYLANQQSFISNLLQLGGFPILDELLLNLPRFTGASSVPDHFFQTTLKRLELARCAFHWDSLTKCISPRLKSLVIRRPETRVAGEDLASLLRSSPELERLELVHAIKEGEHVVPQSDYYSAAERRILPCLTSLRLIQLQMIPILRVLSLLHEPRLLENVWTQADFCDGQEFMGRMTAILGPILQEYPQPAAIIALRVEMRLSPYKCRTFRLNVGREKLEESSNGAPPPLDIGLFGGVELPEDFASRMGETLQAFPLERVGKLDLYWAPTLRSSILSKFWEFSHVSTLNLFEKAANDVLQSFCDEYHSATEGTMLFPNLKLLSVDGPASLEMIDWDTLLLALERRNQVLGTRLSFFRLVYGCKKPQWDFGKLNAVSDVLEIIPRGVL